MRRFLYFLPLSLFFILIPQFSLAATLGYTAVGGSNCLAGTYQWESQWTMPSSTSGAATSIEAYLGSGGATYVQGAIFSDSGGNIGSLLATSSIVSANNSGWNVMSISYPLVASTTYWLGMDTDSATGTACVNDVLANQKLDYNYTPQWNTWNTSPGSLSGYVISLYINYTASGGGNNSSTMASSTYFNWGGIAFVRTTETLQLGSSTITMSYDPFEDFWVFLVLIYSFIWGVYKVSCMVKDN